MELVKYPSSLGKVQFLLPRKGTETKVAYAEQRGVKYSSIPLTPQGDGNRGRTGHPAGLDTFNSSYPARGRKLRHRGRSLRLWRVQFLLSRKGTETTIPITIIRVLPGFNSSYPARGRKLENASNRKPYIAHGSIPLTPQGDGNYPISSKVCLDSTGSIPLTPQGDGNLNQGRRMKAEGRRDFAEVP